MDLPVERGDPTERTPSEPTYIPAASVHPFNRSVPFPTALALVGNWCPGPPRGDTLTRSINITPATHLAQSKAPGQAGKPLGHYNAYTKSLLQSGDWEEVGMQG